MMLSTLSIALLAQAYVLLLIALLGLCVIVRRLRRQLADSQSQLATVSPPPANPDALVDNKTPLEQHSPLDQASTDKLPHHSQVSPNTPDTAETHSSVDVQDVATTAISTNTNNTDDFIKLRNLAAFQFRTIHKLQKKLDEAETAAEKNEVIKQLEQELYRHIRFLNESDTCMQLLEEELHRANQELARLHDTEEELAKLREENARLASKLASIE